MNEVTITNAHLAAKIIKERLPNFKPLIGIVLGSGLGQLANQLEDQVIINYNELPGFPKITVHGHSGQMVLGYLSGIAVICLQGRCHTYEGCSFEPVKTYVRTLKLLGCQYFLATNASGSMREEAKPGDLMLIKDHINLQPGNPLIGPNDDAFGPRFLPLDGAYDISLRHLITDIAKREHIPLHHGVYLAVSGPNYETAAEIRAFRTLGADAVGMSTVPEVLVAHHCGLKIAVIATMTNYATGLSNEPHSHDEVVKTAEKASLHLTCLIKEFVLQLPTLCL